MKLIKKTANLLAIISIVLLSLNSIALTAFAAEFADDGAYEIEFDSDMPSMGLSAFENKEKKALVEKIGENYYITISVNSDVVSNFKILGSSMKVGEMVKNDGSIERHTYTVTKENLSSKLKFSATVIAMDRTVEFTIEPKLETAKKIGDIENLSERPALFVPVIETIAGDAEMEKGSTYIIPQATATLGEVKLDVSCKVYFMDKGSKTEVELKDNKIVFSKVGEYQLVFRAESDKYKTSEGNNTYAEINIRFVSKIGASTIAGFEDKNSILEKDTQLQASIVKNGEIFDKVSALMSDYSDNYQIFSIEFFSADGEMIELPGEIKLSLRADDTFDRREVKVFYLNEDGTLKEYDRENFGRYLTIDTDKTGTYIVCTEGIEFRMPMWGYAAIAGTLLLAVIIVVVAVICVKRKKRVK